jgi:hypothetical protein
MRVVSHALVLPTDTCKAAKAAAVRSWFHFICRTERLAPQLNLTHLFLTEMFHFRDPGNQPGEVVAAGGEGEGGARGVAIGVETRTRAELNLAQRRPESRRRWRRRLR